MRSGRTTTVSDYKKRVSRISLHSTTMVTLYPEQVQPCDQALAILNKMNLVYIAAEVRSGKTPISLLCAYRSGWRRICVLTTKKAISGFEKFNPRSMFTSFTIMNYINNHKNIEKMDNAYFDG